MHHDTDNTDSGVCCRVAIATWEISQWADNGGREEKATAGKATTKKEGDNYIVSCLLWYSK